MSAQATFFVKPSSESPPQRATHTGIEITILKVVTSKVLICAHGYNGSDVSLCHWEPNKSIANQEVKNTGKVYLAHRNATHRVFCIHSPQVIFLLFLLLRLLLLPQLPAIHICCGIIQRSLAFLFTICLPEFSSQIPPQSSSGNGNLQKKVPVCSHNSPSSHLPFRCYDFFEMIVPNVIVGIRASKVMRSAVAEIFLSGIRKEIQYAPQEQFYFYFHVLQSLQFICNNNKIKRDLHSFIVV